MTSHGVSPNNNPLNNQKLYVPMASMPQKRNERPVTAHPQSRTQHYQIHGVNEAPQNQNGRPGTGTGYFSFMNNSIKLTFLKKT